jgi:hypothetical protein
VTAPKNQMRAFRERAREIGILSSCICDFPVVRHPTESGHSVDCPSDYMTKVYERMARTNEHAAPPAMRPEVLRAYAAEFNRIADATFTVLAGMRCDELSPSILDDAQTATSRARAVALRLEELAYNMEKTR